MARPIDEKLRDDLLDDVLEAVSRLGLGGLSLTSRRLAQAASGVGGSLPEMVQASWSWMTAPRQRGFVNVFYEVCALGARDPVRRGAVASSLFTDWHALLVRLGVRDESATLLIAGLHGLMLDLVLTGDRERVDRAFAALLATLQSEKGALA